MEKTIQITIGGRQFQITEAAYANLSAYLDRLKARFMATQDGEEIIADIETRIAEKLLDAKRALIATDDIAAVIAEIGEAADLSDEQGSEEPTPEKPGRKRLYRDMDNAYIGGVASGIAAYFDIDPLWIRLAFILSVFVSGAGILLYLVLWLLVPEAKTAGQKLEMRGRPVNIDTIVGMVQERVEEAEKSGALSRGARAIDRIVRTLFRTLGRVIGALLSFLTFFGIIGATVALGIVLTNWNAPWVDIPHKEAISPALVKGVAFAGYFAIVVPLVLVFALGVRAMLRRSLFSTTVGFGLVGVWALSLVGSGVCATKLVGDYHAYTSSHPDYAVVNEQFEVPAFSSIVVQGGVVTIREGDAHAVDIEGRRMDMGNATTSVTEGVLTISENRADRDDCMFCNWSAPHITVTVPTLGSVRVEGGVVALEDVSTGAMALDVRRGSVRGTLTSPEITLAASSASVHMDMNATRITIAAENSHVAIDGTVAELSVTSRNANMQLDDLIAERAIVDADESHVQLHAEIYDERRSESSLIRNEYENAGS